MTGDERVAVCPVDELPPGERTMVQVAGVPVGVFNVDGEFYAVENECAHQGGPVCTGKQQRKLVGEFHAIGERVREQYDADVPVIACPWHGWEYDLRTGEHVGDADFSIAAYETVVEDGVVYVEG